MNQPSKPGAGQHHGHSHSHQPQGSGKGARAGGAPSSPIEHVVILVKENHTLDNYSTTRRLRVSPSPITWY